MSDREGETSEEEIARVASELVAFFRQLPPSARQAYARLASLDRERGERVDVAPGDGGGEKEGAQ